MSCLAWICVPLYKHFKPIDSTAVAMEWHQLYFRKAASHTKCGTLSSARSYPDWNNIEQHHRFPALENSLRNPWSWQNLRSSPYQLTTGSNREPLRNSVTQLLWLQFSAFQFYFLIFRCCFSLTVNVVHAFPDLLENAYETSEFLGRRSLDMGGSPCELSEELVT